MSPVGGRRRRRELTRSDRGPLPLLKRMTSRGGGDAGGVLIHCGTGGGDGVLSLLDWRRWDLRPRGWSLVSLGWKRKQPPGAQDGVSSSRSLLNDTTDDAAVL